jgi:tellurite resistance protein TerC
MGIGLGAVIWATFGHEAGSKYYAGFFIEKALSIDNIFVWGLILSYLSIPKKYHLKVLFWGIIGAIVFRTIFVVSGLALIEYFQPALIILGVVLLISSYRLFLSKKGQQFDPDNSRIINLVKRYLPFSNKIYGSKLFVRKNGKLMATSLFFAICVVELTDIAFAIDSVPASLAIVRDPYIVLASNIAALLGLRALYFVFEYLEDKFYLLNKGLALILSVVGVTLILEPENIFSLQWFGLKVSPLATISFVGIVLTVSIVLSFIRPKPSINIPKK